MRLIDATFDAVMTAIGSTSISFNGVNHLLSTYTEGMEVVGVTPIENNPDVDCEIHLRVKNQYLDDEIKLKYKRLPIQTIMNSLGRKLYFSHLANEAEIDAEMVRNILIRNHSIYINEGAIASVQLDMNNKRLAITTNPNDSAIAGTTTVDYQMGRIGEDSLYGRTELSLVLKDVDFTDILGDGVTAYELYNSNKSIRFNAAAQAAIVARLAEYNIELDTTKSIAFETNFAFNLTRQDGQARFLRKTIRGIDNANFSHVLMLNTFAIKLKDDQFTTYEKLRLHFNGSNLLV